MWVFAGRFGIARTDDGRPDDETYVWKILGLEWAIWEEGEEVVLTGRERMSEREHEGDTRVEGSIEEYRKENVHGEARGPN
jgi:hypothetical protein